MPWYVYVSYFFGGAFLTNAIPHVVNGLSGRDFPSPFASPPGKGRSSPTVNVLWGALNLVVAYLLIARVAAFNLRETSNVVPVLAGALLTAVMLARAFGQIGET